MSNDAAIGIVYEACRLPDAASPAELWADRIEGRRSFRHIPSQRIDLARYSADAVGEADSITPVTAGLLTNWKFDRSHFKTLRAAIEATT